ncbi:DUF2325 domain-containing protein [Roseateles sp. BYS87W]|uniref:DUF2325 domain-containing protein n=1 Tax=Pelomonas baiyunensis TaxID=3299026 RepID=A0ABW7GVW9_9BURK
MCLPLERGRALARRHLTPPAADDYSLHCTLVSMAGRRNAVSEAVHKDLEQQHALLVRQAASAKTTDALAVWWASQAEGCDLAGALWATLTHPRCDEPLELRVLAQVHMLQHQVGAAQRQSARRYLDLAGEHQTLLRAYAEVQQRMTAWTQARAAEQQQWERERIQLRGEVLRLRTELALRREALPAVGAAVAAASTRATERIPPSAASARCASRPRPADDAPVARSAPATPPQVVSCGPRHLAGSNAAQPLAPRPRVVLCVGGRSGSVPHYRQAVEGRGVAFLHHDGGEEHKPAQLEPQLAAADLVICQTGCISHDAYWRVKDHCKRHHKRCVFVETPSRSAFERVWAEITLSEGSGPVE